MIYIVYLLLKLIFHISSIFYAVHVRYNLWPTMHRIVLSICCLCINGAIISIILVHTGGDIAYILDDYTLCSRYIIYWIMYFISYIYISYIVCDISHSLYILVTTHIWFAEWICWPNELGISLFSFRDLVECVKKKNRHGVTDSFFFAPLRRPALRVFSCLWLPLVTFG